MGSQDSCQLSSDVRAPFSPPCPPRSSFRCKRLFAEAPVEGLVFLQWSSSRAPKALCQFTMHMLTHPFLLPFPLILPSLLFRIKSLSRITALVITGD